jgi:hypothetical protein
VTHEEAPLNISALLDIGEIRDRLAWVVAKPSGYEKRQRYYEETLEQLTASSDDMIVRIDTATRAMGEQQRHRIVFEFARLTKHEEWLLAYMTLLEAVRDLEPAHPKVFGGPYFRAFINGLKLMSPMLDRTERSQNTTAPRLGSREAEEIALLRFGIQMKEAPEFRNLYVTRSYGNVTGLVITASYLEEMVRSSPAQADSIALLVASGITDPPVLDRMIRAQREDGIKLSLSEGWL